MKRFFRRTGKLQLYVILPLFISYQLSVISYQLFSASLNLDVDYQLRGFSYTNLDYNTKTSTDAVAYYTQRLKVALVGKFIPEIEICTKLQAIGVVSSERGGTHQQFNWQKEYPYPNTGFIPFVENAYARLTKFLNYPVELTIGRQPLQYGGLKASRVDSWKEIKVDEAGFIVSDNDAGMNAIKIAVDYPYKLHTELFTAKIKENFYPSKDFDIHGIVAKHPVKGYNIQFGYFNQTDFRGTEYTQGAKSTQTASIGKQFYSLRISRSGSWGYYYGEYIFQIGNANLVDGTNVRLDGRAVLLEGRLFGEQKRLGKVSGYGIIAGVTGGYKTKEGENVGPLTPGDGWFPTDETFIPELTRRFDGLKRAGWGEYFGLSAFDSLWDKPMQQIGAQLIPAYSGFGTFGFGLDFSPWYGWTFGAGGFYFSAARRYGGTKGPFAVGYAGGGTAVSLDALISILLGQKLEETSRYGLGAELNLFAKYSYSKYIDFKLSYSRYTPPGEKSVWPYGETSDFYLLEINTKF